MREPGDDLEPYDYERGSVPARGDLSHDRTASRGLVSMFSDNKKIGRWELPRHMRVLAVFGSATIDLRQAYVSHGVSVIEALAIFGNIEVIVPPEIAVECDGDAVMGSFTLKRAKRGPASLSAPLGAPVVRVTGDAYAASVEVVIKALKEKSSGWI
jgi:hypothetical protein